MSYQLGSVDSDCGAELYADPREHEGGPRFRGLIASLVAVVVIGAFAGGIWFAYQQGLRHGGGSTGAADVPLIRADERPTKVKPENPGGMEVPDRDKLIFLQIRNPIAGIPDPDRENPWSWNLRFPEGNLRFPEGNLTLEAWIPSGSQSFMGSQWSA